MILKNILLPTKKDMKIYLDPKDLYYLKKKIDFPLIYLFCIYKVIKKLDNCGKF